MKPCAECGEPKTWHDSFSGHKFILDNLKYLEKRHDKKVKEAKHKKLNFCQLCQRNKKSPFGICEECCRSIILKWTYDKTL